MTLFTQLFTQKPDREPKSPSWYESRKIYKRLKSSMPKGDSLTLLSEAVEGHKELERRLDDRAGLDYTYEQRVYYLLPLYEEFGEAYSYRVIAESADILRENSPPMELTGEQLEAYASFRSFLKKHNAARGRSMDVPEALLSNGVMAAHVLLHHEDKLALEGIIERGVTDKDRIFQLLHEVKEGTVAPVVSDGFL